MPMRSSSSKQTSSTMSSFMCCTSERSQKTIRYKEQNQSKYLWLDPTRWVEKKTKREEVGIDNTNSNIDYKLYDKIKRMSFFATQMS